MHGWSGQLLVAPAWMTDPSFGASVVLLLQHEGQGAFGLVLNRASETRVAELWARAGEGPCAVEAPVFVGGPVAGPLFALHDRPADGEATAVAGLYLTSDPDALGRLLAHPPAHLRLFAGYAGWGAGQLEAELQDAAWLTTPATAQDAFAPPGEPGWRAALERATPAPQPGLGGLGGWGPRSGPSAPDPGLN
ncbi:MAG: YqgE/AlgH family protein [Planctomycetia bacterium]